MAVRRTWPFWVAAALGIVGGGLIAGFLAHTPSRPAMWLVAYLVLVVGVAQVLAAGQVWLAPFPASPALLASEWILFNAANALVIGELQRVSRSIIDLGALMGQMQQDVTAIRLVPFSAARR